ncbi:MAG TPA: class I SAM-dependent methyltransferase [Rhodobacteraceae bacterium]|nr:class I SAM-dependent methyltransferase [Paracoccaceae bacterium]
MFKRTSWNPEFDAPHNKLQRRLRLLMTEVKFNGVLRTMSLLWSYSKSRTGLGKKPVRKMGQSWPDKHLDVVDIVKVESLSVSEELRAQANRYEATPDLEFRYVLEMLKLDYTQYRFCDYGSGKGGVLAVAARYPFKHVTGVEFCPDLHAIAVKNLKRLSKTGTVLATSVTPVLQDAARYKPPAEPHVFYFYNPFKPSILQSALDQCQSLADTVAEQSYILYKNPVHRDFFDARLGLKKISEPFGGSWAIYEIKAPENA